jgi:hypothetical protein
MIEKVAGGGMTKGYEISVSLYRPGYGLRVDRGQTTRVVTLSQYFESVTNDVTHLT